MPARRARASRPRWRARSPWPSAPPRPPPVRDPRRGTIPPPEPRPRHRRRRVRHRGLGRRRGGRAAQPLREGEELELGQDPDQGVAIRLAQHQVADVELDRHVALDGDEIPRQPGVVRLAEQRLAGALGRDLRRAGKNGLQIAVVGQQLLRPLLADPLYAGHVVGGVADQGQEIHHLVRRHAQPLRAVRLIHPHLVHGRRTAAPRIEQGDARPDELVEILVARHDDRAQPARRAGGGQGADDVVGLVATHRDERDPEGLEQRADPLDRAVEVGLERIVQLLPGGLVLGVALLPERGAGIVDPGDVVGPVLLAQTQEEIHHSPGGGGVLSLGGPERPGDHREEGAIDQRVAVDEEELGRGVVGHRGKIRRSRRTRRSGGQTVRRSDGQAVGGQYRSTPALAGSTGARCARWLAGPSAGRFPFPPIPASHLPCRCSRDRVRS